jgi:carbon-monoxide dehydrogenase small subunit
VTEQTLHVALTVNGRASESEVPVRMLLSDFLRHELGLTGTHIGCEHGVCGCCTIMFNGRPHRSCLLLAPQADGAEIVTVEGLAAPDGTLHPVQAAFRETHGLQCGFCTPGFLITAIALLAETPRPTEEQVVEGLSGNLCRCTGYQNIVRAVQLAAERMAP